MSRLAVALQRALSSWLSARGLGASSAPTAALPAPGDVFLIPGRKFLHVGCGPARKPHVAPALQADDWIEIRLDIDPEVSPDIVSSMLDMPLVPSGAVDAVYSSHNIEHLYPHEVPVALAEFHRVLKPDGLLILTCPDLQALCPLILEDKLDQPAYISPVGPITPLDILYGHRPPLAAGNLFMAHRTGFTLRTLVDAARAAGFPSVAGRRQEAGFALWIVAAKEALSEREMQALADVHLPG